VLFGSQATGKRRPESDFDVGIVPFDVTLPLHEELALAERLSRAADAEVDLVRLDGEDPLLGREVAQTGVCLYESEPGVFTGYRATAMSRWIEFDETFRPLPRELSAQARERSPMTNAPLVARKLALIDEHLRRLRARRPADLESFERDLLVQDAVSLGVLVVVQEAVDIALHIASDEGWELASTYRDAFAVLARHRVIDEALATSLANAAQLRNRIAYGYASLDASRLWAELPSGISSFAAFAACVSSFVERGTNASS
jgi:uncharacterized protein YutE (UPF0331/DUF86 family)/predicted nucleotidyltransferase